MDQALVSIVIPTFNSGGIIGECLESIRAQTYRPIEIIIVDSHSQDTTREVAKGFGATVLIFGPKQSAPFEKVFAAPQQRNFGAVQAKGEYIYYLDSDMRLTPTVVQEALHCIQKEGADAVIIPEFSYGTGFWAQCRILEKACYYHDPLVDAARFVKKEVWQKLGGLDATLGGGDDWDFQYRLNQAGFKTLRTKADVRHYEVNVSLGKQIKKKFVYGQTVDKYFIKHRQHPIFLIKQYSLFRPAYFRNWRMLLRSPRCAAGMLLMKTLEYLAAFLGLLYARLIRPKQSQ